MSPDLLITTTAIGAITSIATALMFSFFKELHGKLLKQQANKTQKEAQHKTSEGGLDIESIQPHDQQEHPLAQQISISQQLLNDIRQSIAQDISEQHGISLNQVASEVDDKIQALMARLQAIENRFPEESLINKIASINDALFAQRIDQLSAHVTTLEGKILSKWDVATIFSLASGAIFTVVGATYSILKLIGKVQ